jgi:hypothetical protein
MEKENRSMLHNYTFMNKQGAYSTAYMTYTYMKLHMYVLHVVATIHDMYIQPW